MLNKIIEKIEPYWQYLSIVAGLVLVYLGIKIAFDKKFLKKLMGKNRVWEHKENKFFTEKSAKNYNRGRGIQIALVGIIFIALGIASL